MFNASEMPQSPEKAAKMTKMFVDTYKKRLDKICDETDQELMNLPKNVVAQTQHIHSMLKKVVEVSMQGL